MSDWDDAAIDWYAENFGEDITNRWVVEAASLSGKVDVLDIGCGTGTALRIAELTTSGRLVGIDPFGRMIEHAKTATEIGSRIKFQVAPAESLPFEDKSFDVVFMINVIHHLKDQDKGLAEAKRVLRPQGRLVFGGERFDEAMIPEGQNYQSTLESHGFTNIETRPLGPHSEGFVTVAVKKAGPDVH